MVFAPPFGGPTARSLRSLFRRSRPFRRGGFCGWSGQWKVNLDHARFGKANDGQGFPAWKRCAQYKWDTQNYISFWGRHELFCFLFVLFSD